MTDHNAQFAAMDETHTFTPPPARFPPTVPTQTPPAVWPPHDHPRHLPTGPDAAGRLRPEFAALARFLTVRDRVAAHAGVPCDPRELRQAEAELLAALRLPTDLDRINDAFTQRLARQKAQGDVKGYTATQSAMRLIDDATRA